jgi:hypothetical protein
MAKNAVVDRATQIGESLRIVGRGTAAANRKKRMGGELDNRARAERADAMSGKERVAELRRSKEGLTGATGGTREGRLDRAAIYKAMAKDGQLGMLSKDEQMEFLNNSAEYGVKAHEVVGKMSTENQIDIVRNNKFNPKTREEALKALSSKGQLNTSIPGSLTLAQLVPAMEELRANGSDLKDIIGGLKGEDLAWILTRNQDNVGTGRPEVLNAQTRAKILKALADKKQLDLIGNIGESIAARRGRKIEAILEAQEQGILPQDIINKMNSEDQADIINRNLFNPEVRGKTVEILMKKGELNLIEETNRPTIYKEAIESGGLDVEDLENRDYRAAAFNEARINRIKSANPTFTQPQLEEAAKNQMLDENINSMNGEQLRDIDVADLFGPAGSLQYQRVARLTPEKIRQFQSAPSGHRAVLKTHIPALDAEILNERALAAAARILTPPDQAEASQHTSEANRLLFIRNAIHRLP